MIFHQGQLVRVASNQDSTYQVLSIDDAADLCWVRRWPLDARNSPTFAVRGSEIRPQVVELRR